LTVVCILQMLGGVGPQLLIQDENVWPIRNPIIEPTHEEERKHLVVCHITEQNAIKDLIDRTNSLLKLTRIIAYCRRIRYLVLSPLSKNQSDARRTECSRLAQNKMQTFKERYLQLYGMLAVKNS